MYKVFFVNFGYYSANVAGTLDEAKAVCRKAGFQSVVEDHTQNGAMVASYCPIAGWKLITQVKLVQRVA